MSPPVQGGLLAEGQASVSYRIAFLSCSKLDMLLLDFGGAAAPNCPPLNIAGVCKEGRTSPQQAEWSAVQG